MTEPVGVFAACKKDRYVHLRIPLALKELAAKEADERKMTLSALLLFCLEKELGRGHWK